MKTSRTVALVALFLVFVMGLGVGGFAPFASAKTVIKITHVLDPSHHYQAGALKFKELVEKKTGNQIEVQIYPAAQLGSERVVLEGLQMGTIEMGIITSGALSGFVPDFSILDLGYLFKDNKQAVQVLNGPTGKALIEKMKTANIRGLAPVDCGFRSVYANRPVKDPSGLKGMKIRTMENPAHLAAFRAIGASPLPMAWGELYTALQQGVVDGAEIRHRCLLQFKTLRGGEILLYHQPCLPRCDVHGQRTLLPETAQNHSGCNHRSSQRIGSIRAYGVCEERTGGL